MKRFIAFGLIIILTMGMLHFCSEDKKLLTPYNSKYNPDKWKPTKLEIYPVNIHSVELQWDQDEENIDGFMIDKKIGNEDWLNAFDTVDYRTKKYIDTSAVPGQEIIYNLYAYADENQSKPQTKTITLEFPAPSDLNVIQRSLSEIQLSWKDNSDGESGFGIDRKAGSQAWEKTFAMVNASTWIDTSVIPKETYQYRVYGYCNNHFSDKIDTTITCTFPKPENLTITQESDVLLTLNWEDNINGEDGYIIDRKTNGNNWQNDYAIVDKNETSWSDVAPEYGVENFYRVRAYIGDEKSDYEEASINNFIHPPYNLVANYNTNEFVISWEDSCTFESGFLIEKRVDGGAYQQLTEVVSNIHTYTDEEIEQDMTYQYRVCAKTDNNQSQWAESNELNTANTPPVAEFSVSPASGTINTVFNFDASGSYDAEDNDDNLLVRWDIDNDGTWDVDYTTEKTTTHTYSTTGTYTVKLEVKDSGDLSSQFTRSLFVSDGTVIENEMVFVEGGTFTMGDVWGDGDENEKPTHEVTLSDFYIGKYEVTQKQYSDIIGIEKWNNEVGIGDNYPAYDCNWYEAVEFCNSLSEQEGYTPFYSIDKNNQDPNNNSNTDNIKWIVTYDWNANGYRLPTEAEWEYAARSQGRDDRKWSGTNTEDDLVDYAWFMSNSNSKMHSVGMKQPNDIGIYDMSGNAWELCWDWYSVYSESPTSNPTGPSTGSYRVLRGGRWDYDANYCRTVYRRSSSPNDVYDEGFTGFRLARSVNSDIDTSTVTDYDNNVYKTVKIGDQWWMAENLKVTHYRNGDPIPNVTDNTEWSNLNTGAYCAYDNNEDNAETYGYLYNWYSVDDARNIAPEGWHVATDEEWKKLEMAIGMSKSEADKMFLRGTNEGEKLKSTYGWDENGNGLDKYEFSALPGGVRGPIGLNSFSASKWSSYFWTSTSDGGNENFSFWRQLLANTNRINRDADYYSNGMSIRCIKGELNPTNTPPTASFNIFPESGTTDTEFSFDASGCSDTEDATSSLQVRWDFENDDTWDTGYFTTKTTTHQYATAGTYTCLLEVLDTGGLTDQISKSITVEVNDDPNIGTVNDIDGNTYKTVKIGDQWWMAENLKVTRYRNGDAIPYVTSGTEWTNLSSGAYCAYDNEEYNADIYGYLYNWYAVEDSRNIAPEGWHVATLDDWNVLASIIGTNPGMKLKSTSGWNDPEDGVSGNGTDEYGFNALPGGCRGKQGLGNWGAIGYDTNIWTYSEHDTGNAGSIFMHSYSTILLKGFGTKAAGFSVRCVKGELEPRNTPPSASFTISPESGTTNTEFSFDASECSDSEDGTSYLQVRWDFENDGTWDTGYSTTKTTTHTYTTAGTYTCLLEVIDTGGLTDQISKSITVEVNDDPNVGTVTDIDGNTYKTVKIGDQWWMAENLKVTHYQNGDAIPNVMDDTEWSNLSTGAFCNYNNDGSNADTYGYLYNWYTFDDNRNIAPIGWHIPTDEEWKELEMYIGMSQSESDDIGWRGTNEGKKLKSTTGFNGNGTDDYDFAAMPAGYRDPNGNFNFMGYSTDIWSATEDNSTDSWSRSLNSDNARLYRNTRIKKYGFSVRCVKGEVIIENISPTSSFIVSPSSGTLDTVFIFDASDCSDSEDDVAVLQVRWDYENDGVWDTDYSTAKIVTHQFAEAKTYTVKLEVKDTGGLTNQITKNVVVSEDTNIETGTITDIDGNTYKTVKIGNQWWMAENLKVTHYRNGDAIPNIIDNTEWSNLSTGAYCIFDNDDINIDKYGNHYNWYAVDDSRNIAPEGWHVSTDEEWTELTDYLGINSGTIIKSTTGWLSNGNGTDDYGFNALPVHERNPSTGNFGGIGTYAFYWTATEYSNDNIWSRGLDCRRSDVNRFLAMNNRGQTVRCVKDTE